MSFDLNILVNGNRCKQYYHQGKTFIEAKNGSEYVIQINNNHWKRILAVGSVDGLNILTGKAANEKDSGYIVGAYSSEKIKGFRFSDDEWAMFKFGYKFNGNTYAQSKENGSEKNCGVIGLRLFYEKEPLYTYNPPIQWNTTPQWLSNPSVTTVVTTTTTTRGATASYALTGGMNQTVNYCCSDLGQVDLNHDNTNYSSLFGGCAAAAPLGSGPIDGTLLKEAIADAKAVRQTALANPKSADSMMGKFTKLAGITKGGQICADTKSSKKRSSAGGQSAQYCADTIAVAGAGLYGPGRYGYTAKEPEFDMGTEWGRKEHSKVHNVPFERGCQAQSFDIYYASREALIAMGIPLFNELQVGLPQSFPNGYAQPPKNWVG
jgi:hypothetical protein